MIAKRVPRDKGTSSPARLVRYMVAAVGEIDPNTWARTSDYILDSKGKTSQGEKVESYRVSNCGTDDPAAAAILIEATQAANVRSKSDKTYHLVYSFPPGEQPPLEVLHAIEDELCEAIGYADHQRVSAVHNDTDHLHVHVAINKVHPTGFQNIEPYYDKKRLMETCERLEIKYGLERTNHGIEEPQHDQSRERDRSGRERIELGPGQLPGQRDSRFRRYLRESSDLAFADEPEAKTLNDLRTLSGCHMVRASEGSQMLLQGNARPGLQQRREERTNSVRRPGNGDRATTSQTGESGRTRVGGKAADIESQSGIETLTGYAAREVAPALRTASTWQELHAVAADHGLQIKQRGAGLVIGDQELGIWAKCSNVGRDLSSKALTDRLGTFEPSQQQEQAKAARRRYEAKPRSPERPNTTALFAQYQRERQAAIQGRRQGFADISRDSAMASAQLKQWSKTQRMLVKVAGKGVAKQVMYSTIKQQADATRNRNRQTAQARRDALFKQTGTPSWADWLTQQAERGNADALAVMRDRDERARRWQGDLLTANRADKAKAVVLDKLKPKARKDGTMAYSTIDGGMVIDRNTHVQAQKATTGAALVALELASKRFDGQPLVVEGTAEFRQEVAQLAGMHGFKVRFADPGMEQIRRDTAGHKAMEQEFQAEIRGSGRDRAPKGIDPAKPQRQAPRQPLQRGDMEADFQAAIGVSVNQSDRRTGEKAQNRVPTSPAVEKWIAERNESRDKISSLNYHREWQSSDAGKATYQGRRRLEDGIEVLLLKRNDETLVKPSTSRVVAKATTWKIGREVELDARGRFKESGKGPSVNER